MKTHVLLNPQQQRAIEHVEGPLLVLAGAGSGKTHVVTHRIAHLINLGIPPSEIVAVTFTNKAAQEMASRVRSLCQQYVLTCTFHSLCARILRESIQHLGYTNDFHIYDQGDSELLLKKCLKSFNIEIEKNLVRSFKTAISNAKNDLLFPSDLNSLDKKQDSFFFDVYSEYQRELKASNALDFDDLLLLTVDLLQKHSEIKRLYQKRWTFFLIDEYQDTNKAQYQLTCLLSEEHRNLFVVGDPDQSIYSFRGANVKNILNFKEDFKDAIVLPLEQNYRSTMHILSAANQLINYNTERYEKQLWSDLGDGDKVHVLISDTEQEEAAHIIQHIRDYQHTFSLRDMVLFYRTNSQSRIYEDYLLRYKIPYQIIGGLSFYSRKEIKDILAFAKILLNPSDFLSFERTIHIPKRGFGSATLAKMKNEANALHLPILEYCKGLTQGAYNIKLSKKQLSALNDYITTIAHLKETIDQSIASLLHSVLTQFHYIEYLKHDEESFIDRKSNIDELISKAVEWEEENENGTLAQFLEELTLKAQIDDHNPQDDSIKMMTLHNSKGLEFPIVFIVGMEEDIFPHINSKESPTQIEEERRLAYVGMTRAKQHLHLSASKYRLIWGTPRIMKPSRFLQELPEEDLTFDKKASSYTDFTEDSGLPAGTVVKHKCFGRGVIKKAYQTSLGLTYDVFFPESSSLKTLIAKYAKLEPF